MNIIARGIFVSIVCLLLSNCTPGMLLQFKNETNEDILLKYSICDDLLDENREKMFEGIIAMNEIVDVSFVWPYLHNRGVTQEDYKNKETFLTIFESIEIEKLNSNEKISEKDLENYGLEYIKKGVSGHIFILRIL
jgi:hypothetical protein